MGDQWIFQFVCTDSIPLHEAARGGVTNMKIRRRSSVEYTSHGVYTTDCCATMYYATPNVRLSTLAYCLAGMPYSLTACRL